MGLGLLVVFANANARWERGRWPKYEMELLGLNFRHAIRNRVEISGGRQWGGADEVVVAVGHCVHKWEAGE